MLVNQTSYRTIWRDKSGQINYIDQRNLPHRFIVRQLTTLDQCCDAIKDMHVRGAPLIGVTAAFGMAIAATELTPGTDKMTHLNQAAQQLNATRPTAVNLSWAVKRQLACAQSFPDDQCAEKLFDAAQQMANDDVKTCNAIGQHGFPLIQSLHDRYQRPINILTHCNAGWLATIDRGTATAPIYAARDAGIPIHVWVDETRPRNQGARLTAWELGQENIDHTVIVDNVGGHLMQHDLVDLVLTGTDRTTRTGDVANKIGTYLKALAAHDNNVPFYVALPSSTIDWNCRNGVKEIPIEQRSGLEVSQITGALGEMIETIQITPQNSPVANYAFDVTPSRLVTGLITERGCCDASEVGLTKLFPELA